MAAMLLAGCGKTAPRETADERYMTGAYGDYHELDDEAKQLFADTYDDTLVLTPQSVATQVVAGLNYRFVCTDPEGQVVRVVIYQPLPGQGPARVTHVEREGETELEWCLKLSEANPEGFTADVFRRRLLTEGIVASYAETQCSEGLEGLQRCIDYAKERTGIVGGWSYEGHYFFDADTIFSEERLEEAIAWARAAGQKAVYVLSTGREVLVGE